MKPHVNISITPARLALLVLLYAAIAIGANEAIDYGSRLIKGSLTVVGTTTHTGVTTFSSIDAGLVKTDLLDAGAGNFEGPVRVNGVATIATVKGAIIDGGQYFAQGFGPITRFIPFTTASINFASGTIVCEDSAGTTVTGARTTDGCFVGMPSTLTAGGTGLHHTFSCYVSAADTIKVRACAAGTVDDPGAVTFTGFVFSSAQ